MHAAEAVVAVATLLVVVGVLGLRRRRPCEEAGAAEPSHALVRVLTTEEELRAAARRAAQFESVQMSSLEARARRYQVLAGPSTPTPLPSLHPAGRGDATDPQPPAA